MRGDRTVMIAVALLLALYTSAMAQFPQTPPQPGSAPVLPPGIQPQPLPSAVPDTVRLTITGASSWPVPVAVAVWPDTLQFGDLAHLTIDFPEAVAGFAPDSLRFGAPWVELVTTEPPPEGWDSSSPGTTAKEGAGTTSSPPTAGWRVEVPLRIYRAGPFVAVWAPESSGPASAVVQVSGRTVGTDQIAPIRQPRTLGWRLTALLITAAVIVGLAVLIWWLWHRRRQPQAVPADRVLAPPPELAAAEALWELEQAELTARGSERQYLDRLSQVVRTFLRDRYHLAAGELTAAEIVPAGQRLGYRTADLVRYAELIRDGDQRRYRPDAIASNECLTQMTRALALIGDARRAEVITPVAPGLRLAADQAWARLQHRFAAASEGRSSEAASAGPTGGER